MHAAPALPELQRRFLDALYDDAAPGPLGAIAGNGLEPSARLRIYRNSCRETQVGALCAAYPAVLALVGPEFFDQTARGYRHAHPSAHGNLQAFSAGFAECLEALPALGRFPYVPDVARLEWQRQRCALAADAAAASCLMHPSVRTLASRHPVLTIFRYALEPSPEGLELSGPGEQVVLWRADGEVAMATPDAASFACVDALIRGRTLADAQAAALAQNPAFDLAACMTNLVANGLVVTLAEPGLPASPHQEIAP